MGAASRFRRAAPIVAPALIVVLAALLRLPGLHHPDRLFFDERHYVPDAREYLDRGVEVERPSHPPAGKWMVAASMRAVGDRPVGWRLVPALGGVVTTAATYAMARRLWRSVGVASLAGLFIATDGLSIAMSRISMLDGIQTPFVALGSLFTLLDLQTHDRRWRWAAGLALGTAMATKWSSAPVLVVCAAAIVVSDLRRPGRAGRLRSAVGVALPMALVPLAVYLLSYAGWAANVERSEWGRETCPRRCSVTEVAEGWVHEQWEMFAIQRRIVITHPDRSQPGAWLTVSHPVMHYAESCLTKGDVDAGCEVEAGQRARILGLGNPALWWPALAAYGYVAWRALRHRNREAAFVGLLGAVQVVPWMLSWNPGYAFYMTPVVPFVALSLALSLRDAARRWPRAGGAVGAVVVVANLAVAAWLYPIWVGWEISPSAMDARLWLPGWR